MDGSYGIAMSQLDPMTGEKLTDSVIISHSAGGKYYYALNIVKDGNSLYAELEKHIHDEKIVSSRVQIENTDRLTLHDDDLYRCIFRFVCHRRKRRVF